jgi:hypothetical protein
VEIILSDDFDDDFPQGRAAGGGNMIPFARQKQNPAIVERWARELELDNKRTSKSHRFISPLDAFAEMKRKAKLPALPMPWPDFQRRCTLYPGELIGICGPTGGGKTSFAIEMARHALPTVPMLWLPLELDPPQVNTRLIANIRRIQMYNVREWLDAEIERELLQLSDRWRFVDKVRGIEAQVEALRAAIRIARKVYGVPPMFVIDYIGKLARGASRDARAELADAIEILRQLAIDEECYGALLSQTSRGNNGMLTGRVEMDAAADAIGVSAETGELEHAVAVNVALNVFKLDDAEVLDAHVLVTKARNTGLEGRIGFTFQKAGGSWQELNYLPASPGEVTKEVAARKRDKSRVEPAEPKSTRAELNASKENQARYQRAAILEREFLKVGFRGLHYEQVRRIITGREWSDAIAILVGRGAIEVIDASRWRITARNA